MASTIFGNTGSNIIEGFHNTLTHDPYNWPFPQRSLGGTMSLSTIKPEDVGNNVYQKVVRQSSTMHIGGINCALPKTYETWANKPSFSNKNDDIEMSSPKKLHQPLNKPYYNMKTNDLGNIKKATFMTSRATSNPLEPSYKLQSYEPLPPPESKFIRNSILVDDIEKARPTPMRQYKFQRPSNFIDDIEGAHPQKDYARKKIYNQLDVNDINKDMQFKTTRNINPLEPKYIASDENKQKYEFGDVIGSTSKRRHPEKVNKLTDFILHSDDIEGAQASTKGNKMIISKNRKDWVAINRTEDVFGAHSGSLKKGINTIRCLNPLEPNYMMPGRTEPTIFDKNINKNNKIQVKVQPQISIVKEKPETDSSTSKPNDLNLDNPIINVDKSILIKSQIDPPELAKQSLSTKNLVTTKPSDLGKNKRSIDLDVSKKIFYGVENSKQESSSPTKKNISINEDSIFKSDISKNSGSKTKTNAQKLDEFIKTNYQFFSN